MTGDWKAELRPSRVHFGAGSLRILGEVLRELEARRVLVVTDRGIRAAGHVERALASARASGLDAFVFDGVEENPGEHHVAAGVVAAREHDVDFLVGLGGGSAMDCAKGVNFVFTNGGRMEDYWGRGKAQRPMLPSVGVPCTAGTGSEAQSFALISRERDHRKMACGDPKARFRAVILDPELLETAPREVVAMTGIDALSHALESYVTTAGNPFSQMFAREAWRRLDANFEAVVRGEAGVTEWGEMLVGAHLAGAAIEASMLGAAHATANPLSAGFDISHGEAVAIMLPATLRFNAAVAEEMYRDLTSPGAGGGAAARGGAAESLARRIEQLREIAGLRSSLRACGIAESDLDRLAHQAAEQWTAGYNPRRFGTGEALEVYRAAW